MLEQQALLLRPWADLAQPINTNDVARIAYHCVRPVCALDTGICVGHVCRMSSPPQTIWNTLLPPPLEIRELADASLLLSVRRSWCWGSRWHVIDAEGQAVGAVRWRKSPACCLFPYRQCTVNFMMRIEDQFGARIAQLRLDEARSTGAFCTSEALELGILRQTAEGTVVTFLWSTTDNPFLRMLLLAAAVVWGEEASTCRTAEEQSYSRS